jgi:DNA-binding response OmpR family regulator
MAIDTPAAGASASRPPRILLVEDDLEMRLVVADSLRKDGYEIVDAIDGAHFLRRITETLRLHPRPDPIDLIISDVRMPAYNGLDIVRGLREAGFPAPIVVMTAFCDDDVRRETARLGATLMDKPFKMDTLRAVVRDLLARAGQKSHPVLG